MQGWFLKDAEHNQNYIDNNNNTWRVRLIYALTLTAVPA